jgi:hypothetical protein
MGPLSLFVNPEIFQHAMPEMGFGQRAVKVEESSLLVWDIQSSL